MKYILQQLLIFINIFTTISTNCDINEKFCISTQTCINKNITCLNNCDLCLRRKENGENINCINDCENDTNHLINDCIDTHCEDIIDIYGNFIGPNICESGYILQKNKCQCTCVPQNINCNRNYLCPKITYLSIPNDNINGYSVYELSVILKSNAYNMYAIYGNNEKNMIIPTAYQVHQHIGSNIGGINPVILNYIHDSIFDSWFTISVTDGNDMGYINSIGIDWINWSQTQGLIINNGAIFINDPELKLSNTNEYIIGHLTLNDNEAHSLHVNINGKINDINISPSEMDNFQEYDIIFNIPKKNAF